MSQDEHCLTVREVARIFHVSTGTVYRKVKGNEWPALQADDGYAIRFTIEHVARIKTLSEKQAPATKSKGRVRDMYRNAGKGIAA